VIRDLFAEDGTTKIEVRLENENVWLSQQQMAELYQSSRTNVVEHIRHIFEEGELDENSTCRKFRQVQTEGSRSVEREIPFYNLDMIISLGYIVAAVVDRGLFKKTATFIECPFAMANGCIEMDGSVRHGSPANLSNLK
jgi:hypothetical protein